MLMHKSDCTRLLCCKDIDVQDHMQQSILSCDALPVAQSSHQVIDDCAPDILAADTPLENCTCKVRSCIVWTSLVVFAHFGQVLNVMYLQNKL